MYDAELDANGGYDDGDECILTDEERELWAMETQAAIDADFDARYDMFMEHEQRTNDMVSAAYQPPY